VKIAIAQPTYLPWLGYFDLLDQADQFVLLDSVQFEKRSWQQRNRIKTPTGLQWLTVPVISRGKREQRIVDAKIGEEFWLDHLRSIEMNYRRAPFFNRYYGAVGDVLRSAASGSSLATLTISLLRWFASVMDIRTPTLRSSELPTHGRRTDLLAEICGSLGATNYLSPLGSAEYLVKELPVMKERGIEVAFQHYEHPVYRQLFPPFQHYACALDLLFNEGENALAIIRSGRRAPLLPHEAALQLHAKVST
jgi:WbqC-like protein family